MQHLTNASVRRLRPRSVLSAVRALAVLLFVMSFVLLASTAVVSYWFGLLLWVQKGPDRAPVALHGIIIERGGFEIHGTRRVEPVRDRPAEASWRWAYRRAEEYPIVSPVTAAEARLARLGFRIWRGWRTGPAGAIIEDWNLTLPGWLLIIHGAAAVWLISRACRRKLQEYRSGHPVCPECGYDLRATPHRCPECGHSLHDAEVLPKQVDAERCSR